MNPIAIQGQIEGGVIYVEKEHLLPVSYGGKGIGEIATIGTAPAVQNAYHQLDGELRWRRPLDDTPYSRKRAWGDERLSVLKGAEE